MIKTSYIDIINHIEKEIQHMSGIIYFILGMMTGTIVATIFLILLKVNRQNN